MGEYKNESMSIVISPEAKPRKPLINPENKITNNIIIKFSGIE